MKRFSILLFCCCFFGCKAHDSKEEDLKASALKLQSYQTYVFDNPFEKNVLHALVLVLEQEGYEIKNIHYDLGFINAQKTSATVQLTSQEKAPTKLEMTANIYKENNQTKVKVNFITKTFDNQGIVKSLDILTDQKLYEHFFFKIRKKISQAKDRNITKS